MKLYSLEELKTSKQLILSIYGIIYDVNNESKLYEKNGRYSFFIWNDITFCLLYHNLDHNNLNKSITNINLKQDNINKLLNWINIYNKKYKIIGYLNDNSKKKLNLDCIDIFMKNNDENSFNISNNNDEKCPYLKYSNDNNNNNFINENNNNVCPLGYKTIKHSNAIKKIDNSSLKKLKNYLIFMNTVFDIKPSKNNLNEGSTVFDHLNS